MDAYGCVLVMSFFRQLNPVLNWRERTMIVQHKGDAVTLPAFADEQLPVLSGS
jgi:hypothetical protein